MFLKKKIKIKTCTLLRELWTLFSAFATYRLSFYINTIKNGLTIRTNIISKYIYIYLLVLFLCSCLTMNMINDPTPPILMIYILYIQNNLHLLLCTACAILNTCLEKTTGIERLNINTLSTHSSKNNCLLSLRSQTVKILCGSNHPNPKYTRNSKTKT